MLKKYQKRIRVSAGEEVKIQLGLLPPISVQPFATTERQPHPKYDGIVLDPEGVEAAEHRLVQVCKTPMGRPSWILRWKRAFSRRRRRPGPICSRRWTDSYRKARLWVAAFPSPADGMLTEGGHDYSMRLADLTCYLRRRILSTRS